MTDLDRERWVRDSEDESVSEEQLRRDLAREKAPADADWLNAVIEVTVPLDVSIDAPAEDWRAAAERALELVTAGLWPFEGWVATVRVEGASHD